MRTDDRVTDHRFTVSADPVFGYRIDGHYDVRFRRQLQGAKWVAPTFCPGCFVPWPEGRVYDRTVHCPAGGGYRGWANNLLCMDRCDADKSKSTWRDGGFIAFLNAKTRWSACRTRQDGCGDDFTMPVCNAHNDFHVWIPVPEDLPRTRDGWYRFQAHHRLLGMPPEITRHVWDRMELIQQGRSGVFVYIGEPCDFEDQPRSLTVPVRGLCWTGGGPTVSTDEARSGKQSLLMSGTSWPNLPQVICEPNSRYRLEAWFKVVPWSDDEKSTARERDASRRVKLARAGKPLPPPIDWDGIAAEAYITAHWYDSSPHHKEWLHKQQTNKATGDKRGWQRVELEFDTPDWNPFVNVVFVVNGSKAYLDDFSLLRIQD
jgi:hypothetical protein